MSLVLFPLAFAPFSSLAQEVELAHREGGKFVGAAGCKSSSCHGGAGEKRSQYLTWSQKDFHTRGYAILTTARSARMAETLRLPPAQESNRCTVCHSPFQSVPPHRLASTARADEGVSCESCHGAAGNWLRGHTRSDWSYNTRVGAGMRDLRNLYVRANACVACHQNLAPEILKAGHPDLFFELDGQSVAQPKHWRDEESWSGVREWLTGQAVALREMSWALGKDVEEDSLSVARWNGLAWLCAIVSAQTRMTSPVASPTAAPGKSDFTSMQTQADALARRASVSDWEDSSIHSLLLSLASTDSDFAVNSPANASIAQRAKRLVLGCDRLTNALGRARGTPLKIETELNQLFADVKTLDPFDATSFASHLRTFRAALEREK